MEEMEETEESWRSLETVKMVAAIRRRQHYKSTRTVDFQSTRCMCELSHNEWTAGTAQYRALQPSGECRNRRNCLAMTPGATCCLHVVRHLQPCTAPSLCDVVVVLTLDCPWIVLGMFPDMEVVDGYQGNLHFPCLHGSIDSIRAHT